MKLEHQSSSLNTILADELSTEPTPGITINVPKTEIRRKQTRKKTVPLVFDSGASAHYYPTTFDKESRNIGKYQITEGVIAKFKNKFVGHISARALIGQSPPTLTQTYAIKLLPTKYKMSKHRLPITSMQHSKK